MQRCLRATITCEFMNSKYSPMFAFISADQLWLYNKLLIPDMKVPNGLRKIGNLKCTILVTTHLRNSLHIFLNVRDILEMIYLIWYSIGIQMAIQIRSLNFYENETSNVNTIDNRHPILWMAWQSRGRGTILHNIGTVIPEYFAWSYRRMKLKTTLVGHMCRHDTAHN